ncbi:MAG TPA: acetoacetate decarboxylase family protein [Candidatus Dormibacteraeota bacterium]|nr:acetoacetate decarboxylase family protein [Candidatus Dormibacteraeota bacterium]
MQSYVIQGREVRLPVEVRDASSGAATYLVDAQAARRLVPEAFEVAEVWPGRALFSLAVIDYRDNDLGAYHEVSIAFFVRRRGERRFPLANIADFFRGRLATYIRHLPVDGSFTRDAGETIWGFPKTVQQIDWQRRPERLTCSLTMDGQHVLTLSLPAGGARTLPEQHLVTYSLIHGAPHSTPFTSSAEGAGFHLGGADLTLGSHPIADELRTLGLPKKALMTMWMERMRGTFSAAEPL